jgi:protein pelota
LLLTDEVLRKVNAEKDAPMLGLLKQVEASRGKISVISTLHDAGKKVKGLGGMAALLRFKLNY